MTAPQYQRSVAFRCASFGRRNRKRGVFANALAITHAAEGTAPPRMVYMRISGTGT